MAAAAASRIEAACALVDAAQHSPLHSSISKRQKLALLKVLQGCKLPVEQLPSLLRQLTSTQWCSDDLNELVNALQDSINVGEMEDDIDSQPCVPAKPGGKRQDYTSFPNFLTQSQWDKLLEPESSDDALSDCQELLKKMLVDMGLRDPSEPTSKTFTIVVLVASEGLDATKKTNAWATQVLV